jgi:superfamily II DNA/RNA helicase
MNILHATTDPTILDRFKQMLGGSKAADIAVGYFFVSGFHAVADDLTRLDKVRLLVGRTDRHTLDEIAASLSQVEALKQRVDAESVIQKSRRGEVARESVDGVAQGIASLPQTSDAEADVRTLRDFITSGRIEIRSYVRSFLHAKAYLCWYGDNNPEPGAAIVGSSNFTLAGFTGNTELNVRVTGDAEMAELKHWFDALWDDSVDVTDEIVVELNRSWALAQTPPYHVYLKALYELYKDQLVVPELEAARRGGPELANFQLDAVSRALRFIDLHGGAFIGDVVGLGKTFIGAEILRQLSYTERYPPLIICPAGLKPMWEVTNELFALGAEVVSMSAIVPPAGLKFDEASLEYIDDDPVSGGMVLAEKFPNRGPVLVDEAHNFRNNLSRRHRALRHYLDTGDHKVVLLSATPQNLGPKDIYQQLRLFLDDLNHGIDLEPLHLEEYFGAVSQWYAYKLALEDWELEYQKWQVESAKTPKKKLPPPDQPKAPNVPRAQIENVLNPVFIRRRRKDIKELYGDLIEIAGKPALFPEPELENIQYRLDKVYAKAGSLKDLETALAAHQGARYRAYDHLLDTKRNEPQYKDLRRAQNRIAGLVRYLLYKRLESSVAALRSTLDVLIRSNRNFRKALEEGFVPIGQTATRVLSGEVFDPDNLLEVLTQEEERRKAAKAKRSTLVHPAADFNVKAWCDELDADYEVLNGVLDRIKPIKPSDDDKLQSLLAYLSRMDVAGEKVLIFSEAETTVNYLYENLNPGDKDPTIAKLSGASGDKVASVVKRFAPKANLKEGEKLSAPEVRILIATDVISEGQNLQDCNRVLNYDLHWNPVRLIQRFGRVDRIGTEHTEIHLNNMWPDTDVDVGLGTQPTKPGQKAKTFTDRLVERIQSFHDFIGLDMQLLSHTEKLNPKAMYRIYVDKKLDDDDESILDEVSSFQRGLALLQKLEQEEPDLWKIITNLPDGIRSALTAKSQKADKDSEDRSRFIQDVMQIDEAQLPLTTAKEEVGLVHDFASPRAGETVALFKSGPHSGAYTVGSDLKPRNVTAGQLLASIECGPTEPTRPLPSDTNERVMAAYGAYKNELSSKMGRARRPGRDTQLRRYVSRELRAMRDEAGDDENEVRRIDVLQRVFLDHVPDTVQQELADARKMQLAGHQLVVRLEALRTRFKLNPPEDDEPDLDQSTEITRIICSDGLA